MKTLRDYFETQTQIHDRPVTGDLLAINMREECLLESEIIAHDDDSITLLADEQLLALLESYGAFEDKVIDVDGTDVDQYDYDTEEEVAEAAQQPINDYDQWSELVQKQGGTVHPQKNRTHMVAQNWSGDIIGEFDLRANTGYVAGSDIAEGLRDPKDNPCWKGYHPVGTKKKNGRTVPNCVPGRADEAVEEGSERCPQCGSTNCKCEPGKCSCKPVAGWTPKKQVEEQEMMRLRELAGMKEPYCDACDRVESQCICDEPVAECGDEPGMQDAGEYDYEGDMAKDDLFTIVRAARRLNGMLDDDENMPEWVQAKINKAADYVDTAADYIESNKQQEMEMDEAEYQGHDVPLNKPMQGDVKKFKVYVKNPATGNIKKVNFGDKTMRIKKSNPARRKSFRARHRCENPGPKTKARYWSCRKW